MNEIRLLPEEKIVLKLRKHWVILVRDTVGTILLAFFPLFLLAIIQIMAPQYANFTDYLAFMSFATALWLLLIFLSLAVIWTDYYLDLWIVTDKRIISVDQISLFNRKVTTLSHERIQEITVKEENFVQAFFKYGTLDIETASPTDGDATMEGIPHPENVRKTILEQSAKQV
jgi:uncharacterized membrane protein YdbT with pleckstrin-like domain